MKEKKLLSLYAILTLPLSLRVQLILCSLSHTFLDMLGDNLSVRIHGVSQSICLIAGGDSGSYVE
jgi:hypothetical protein